MLKDNHRHISILLITFTLLLAAEAKTLTQETFKQRLNAEVSVPFTSSISSYSSALQQLSEQLKDYTPNDEDGLPPEISPSLTTSIKGFVSHLKTASSNANALTKTTSKAVTDNSNAVSSKENQITANQKEIKKAEAQVQGGQVAVNQAQAALNNAQKNLKAHQDAVHHAEKKYKKAKSNCLGRRRRKRGLWKEIKKAVKKVVKFPEKVVKETYKGLCRGLNVFTKNIDKAKRRLRNAQAQVNQAAKTLNQKQVDLQGLKKRLEALRKTHSDLVRQKTQLQSQLNNLKKSRDELAAIDQKMKRTVVFLNNIQSRGSAAQFAVDLGYLLDPANLVQPLQEIGNALKTLTGKNGSLYLPSLSPGQIQALLDKINAIKARIPSS